MKLIFTEHSIEKMAALGLTSKQVGECIQKGARFKQTDGYLTKYTYLRVAYKEIGKEIYKIKTVYID